MQVIEWWQVKRNDKYIIVTQYSSGLGFWGYRTLFEARKNVDDLDIGMWKIKREV